MAKQYEFDKKHFKFRKPKTSVWVILRKAFLWFIASLSMAVLYYVIFALFFSTDEERRLKNENRMYAKEYPLLEEREQMLSEVVEGLSVRDDRIYEEIFHTSAPNMDPGASIDYLFGLDSIPDGDIVKRSEARLDVLKGRAADVESDFRAIIDRLQGGECVVPPMSNPLKDFSFAQTGASVGERINPFYKVKIMHNGLDLIAPAGDPVHAAGDGVVTEVVKSRKGLGNVVTITHKGGYKTRYAHMKSIGVSEGMKVKRGECIGESGNSGRSSGPHLHYEVMYKDAYVNPANYFDLTITTEEYSTMVQNTADASEKVTLHPSHKKRRKR